MVKAIDIKVGSKWIDKHGDIVNVLSVDIDKNSVDFEWANRPDRVRKDEAGNIVTRTVSIERFLSCLTPYVPNAEQPAPTQAVDKPAPSQALTINMPVQSFGQSPLLELQHGDWLQRGMSAKTVKFNIGAGGLAPEVTWEDKCAAIASIDDEPAKSLASILIWGANDNWDWSESFNTVVSHLTSIMLAQCATDNRKGPQVSKHSLQSLAHLMARMVLYFELYELWDLYTVKGRLQFSGIDVKASTYTTVWLRYQRLMVDALPTLIAEIDHYIGKYCSRLRQTA